MKPGDIYVTNDAYLTGSHLNHVTLTLPIFHQGKLVGFSCCMAHWLDIGGNLGGMSDGDLPGGPADPDHEAARPGPGERDAHRHDPPERADSDPRHGRPARADHGGEDRRAALPAAASTATARDAVAGAIAAIMDNAEAMARERTRIDPGRRLRGGILHGRRRRRDRQAGADQGARHRQGRRDDRRPLRGVEAGARLLQFRHHHRLCLRAGRLQVPDLADRLSDQRRLVPQPQGDRAARQDRERDAAGADALLDDLSDDHHRHACSRRCRRRSRIASSPAITPTWCCRTCTASIRRRRNSSSPISVRSAAAGAPSAARTASAARSRSTTATPTTRRTSSRRRNSRWWSSAMRWCRTPAAPAAIAAGSASSAWCARAPTWCSTPSSSAPIAGRGASTAGSKAPATRSGCAATATGRPISRTARCCRRRCGPATPIASAPAAVAATAIRMSGRPSWSRRTCGRATCRPRSRPSTTASWSIRRRSGWTAEATKKTARRG